MYRLCDIVVKTNVIFQADYSLEKRIRREQKLEKRLFRSLLRSIGIN